MRQRRPGRQAAARQWFGATLVANGMRAASARKGAKNKGRLPAHVRRLVRTVCASG
jgi:hypothetical protein